MRNLKRALSLALASVMLLGMMVIGTSAATFTDADEIVNTEAATITAGLGLFAGSEGKFNPAGKVTRAQMATVIVKMLYGSEINADSYKGAGKFSDVASFEGGWAEGYINLCANIGVVSGYGDGTFKPGQELTTAEAVTMLLNALKVDAGEGTWPLTVMSAAEKVELYKDMETAKPSTNEKLTRDQLSVLVWNAVKYSPEGVKGYMVGKTLYTDYIEAYYANGEKPDGIVVIANDSLATKVFDLKSVEGFITANQATGAKFTVVAGKKFDVETTLDQIGHYVTVYFTEEYTSERKPGETYTIVDECEVYTVTDEVKTLKEYRAVFGVTPIEVSNPGNKEPYAEFNGTYTRTGSAVTVKYTPGIDGKYEAEKGTYVVYEGKIVSFMDPATTYAAKVTKVDTTDGKESITLSGLNGGKFDNNAAVDAIVEYDGIAKGDYVTYVMAQTVAVLSKVEEVTGKVTATSTTEIDETSYVVVTMDGKDYIETKLGANNETGLPEALTIPNFGYEYTLYVTASGRLLALKQAAGSADVSDVVYVVGAYKNETTDDYGKDVDYYYAQGIDMNAKEQKILIGVDYTVDADDMGVTSIEAGFYNINKNSNSKWAKAGVMEAKKIEAVEYDEEKGNFLFVGTSETDVTDETSALVVDYTIEVEGVTEDKQHNAFLSANTKFVVYEGELGKALSIEVLTGAVEHDLVKADVLMSQNANKNNIAEIVMIKADKLSDVTSTDFIYVADLDYETKQDLGFYYDVFNGATGEKMTIVVAGDLKELKDADAMSTGFFTYDYDAEDGLYAVTGKDKLTAKNYLNGVDFETEFEGKISVTGATMNAADLKIVDTRSKKTIEKDEIDTITSIEELVDLTVIDEKTVKVSVYADKRVENALVLFVNEIK